MERFLIVGLGNPGAKYAQNRHNVGFMGVDRLADTGRLTITRKKFKGQYGTGTLAGASVVLLKPETFMNLSGQSVSPARSFFNVDVARIIVLHDELDLPFGRVRIKVGGGHAGHNGLRSMIDQLGTKDFVRIRIGIGRPEKGSVSSFVLADFHGEQQEWLADLIERAAEAAEAILTDGVRAAMNRINAK